jgi:hypothetical protein
MSDKISENIEDYMITQNSYNITDHQKSLIAMDSREFSKLMLEKFTDFFTGQDPREPFSMFGFEIGSGWHPVVYELCEKLQAICKPYNTTFKFSQIKEKYGSGRFYNTYWFPEDIPETTYKTIISIIDDLVSEYENKCDRICASTGVYYEFKISNGWIYDICYDEYVKQHADSPEYIRRVTESLKRYNLVKQIKKSLVYAKDDVLESIHKQIQSGKDQIYEDSY